MAFAEKGFHIVGLFDCDEKISGTNIINLKVQSLDKLPEFCLKNKPTVAVLCVPNTKEVEETIDNLVKLGINAFWNFTHFDINSKYPEVAVENVHLSDSLLTLCYKTNSL